ncbi:SusD/RagB family nutrient-binding outer membrane lipoprotein [Mucilaginibacter gynuensis]|uniref:SusD/RagB family nutrient-binding outer membrane lipoprotein n=1 Tax=Mucilaginibacter gynuensis TaxID=1302236 RepID=A0ABP8GV85_9SPHI
MKKRYILGFLVAGATLLASCTKNFEELNTNPDKTTGEFIDPNYLLSQSQITFSQTGYDQLLFQSMWVQSLASTFNYYYNGDKYVLASAGTGYYTYTWNRAYQGYTLIYEMKQLIKDKAEYANLNACGTIMTALMMQRLTDLYGSIPYTEAAQAKYGNLTPKFDTQEFIYTDLLKQLETATATLDASKAGPTTDLFYGGSVDRWKRLGYSVMLRMAMRLVKVAPEMAKQYTEKAYAGGTMKEIDDNARVMADVNNASNSNSDVLRTPDDFREVRWGKTLIDYMKTTNDPRIPAIAEITTKNGLTANQTQTAGNNTASLQMGMPNGYTTSSIANAPGYPGATPADPAVQGDAPAPLGKYSRPRFDVYATDRGSANFIYTYGESELLLAEAATKGWAAGNAAEHYKNALTADLATLAKYNASGVAAVAPADITAYVNAHPLLTSTALEQINMEYWVTTSATFNFNESFANWRRSGYPVLTPVTFTGQYINGQVPRRMPYPTTLLSTNNANYQAAVKGMGGSDDFATRVWWDKQ